MRTLITALAKSAASSPRHPVLRAALLSVCCAAIWYALLSGPLSSTLPPSWRPHDWLISASGGLVSGLVWFLLRAAIQTPAPIASTKTVEPSCGTRAWLTAIIGCHDLRVFSETNLLEGSIPDPLSESEVLDEKGLWVDQFFGLQTPAERLRNQIVNTHTDSTKGAWQTLLGLLTDPIDTTEKGLRTYCIQGKDWSSEHPNRLDMPWTLRLDLAQNLAPPNPEAQTPIFTAPPPWQGRLLTTSWVCGQTHTLIRAFEQYSECHDISVSLIHALAWCRQNARLIGLHCDRTLEQNKSNDDDIRLSQTPA